jgi:8-oxo-dGTP diphosphatase
VSRAVHVAVGVIVGKDGTILIAKRPEKTHQGGLWEFPGGKVEQGETLFNALKSFKKSLLSKLLALNHL